MLNRPTLNHHTPVSNRAEESVLEPFRGAGRAGSFLASPPLTAHRTSHRDRPRPRETVECPDFLDRSQTEEKPMTLESMSEDEILRIANPIMDNLMDASTAIDHERHIRDFSERIKAIVTKEHLQKVCEKYQKEKGYFSRREPVAVFKRPGAVAIIWKQWFSKAPG